VHADRSARTRPDDEPARRETRLCEEMLFPSADPGLLATGSLFTKMFFPLMKKENGREREREREREKFPRSSLLPLLSLFARAMRPFIIGFASKREPSGRSLIRFAAPGVARVAHYLFIIR